MTLKDITVSGFRGINNRDDPERVQTRPTKEEPLVDLVEALNVDIDDSGKISKRAGQTMKVVGAVHSLWASEDGSVCLYVMDGIMYRLDENFVSTPLAGGLSDAVVSYVEANGRIYHSNGETSAVLDQGRVRSWGISLDQIALSTSATAGTMPAGVYLIAMTLLRKDGQESGTGIAQRLDLTAGSGIAFTWTVPDDLDIVGAALYVTAPNGEALLLAATVDVTAGTYTYIGGERSLPLATQWLDAPPVGSALARYRGRIYIAAGDVLYATAPLSYEHCDLRDYRAFDGSEIRFVSAVESGLFVGTAKAVYFLSGASFAEDTLTKKHDGASVRGSVITADAGFVTGDRRVDGQVMTMFATEDGVMVGMPDGSLSNMTIDRYQMGELAEGAAILRKTPSPQYLLSMKERTL